MWPSLSSYFLPGILCLFLPQPPPPHFCHANFSSSFKKKLKQDSFTEAFLKGVHCLLYSTLTLCMLLLLLQLLSCCSRVRVCATPCPLPSMKAGGCVRATEAARVVCRWLEIWGPGAWLCSGCAPSWLFHPGQVPSPLWASLTSSTT